MSHLLLRCESTCPTSRWTQTGDRPARAARNVLSARFHTLPDTVVCLQAVQKLQKQRLEHMPYQEGDTDWREASAGFPRLEPCQQEAAADLGWDSVDLTAEGLDLEQLTIDCKCVHQLAC